MLKPADLNATSVTERPLPMALVGLEKLDGTFTNHLNFQTGQYLGDESLGTLRLFSQMEFLVGMWEGVSADETSPQLGEVSLTRNGNLLHIELPITEASGVYKSYVTYTDVDPQATSGLWQSIELTSGAATCTAGQQIYSLNLPLTTNETDYFIQVMDCAGNVSVLTNNGQYYQFSKTAATISGNAGIAGADLSYSVNGAIKTAIADGNGNYIIQVPVSWFGTVTPYKVGVVLKWQVIAC